MSFRSFYGMGEEEQKQQLEIYMAWGFEILPNGVIRDPYTGAEVDCLSGLSEIPDVNGQVP